MMLLASSNDGVGVFLLLLFVTAVVVAIVVASSARSSRLTAALQRVAAEVGGTVSGGGWGTGEATLQFSLAGRRASMEFYAGSKNRAPYSRLTVDLGGRSPGTLHILPEGFGQMILKFFGAQDLPVGDAEFDADYVVKANPPSLVPQLFSPERRRPLMAAVRRLGVVSEPRIDVDRSQLTIRSRDFITDDSRLLVMVRTAEEFLKALFPAAAPAPEPGIQWGEMKVSGGGECPVCGTEMRDGIVRCEVCKTPHHHDCWQYMGRCSTYACPGRRAVA